MFPTRHVLRLGSIAKCTIRPTAALLNKRSVYTCLNSATVSVNQTFHTPRNFCTNVTDFDGGELSSDKIFKNILDHVQEHEGTFYSEAGVRRTLNCLLRLGVPPEVMEGKLCQDPVPSVFKIKPQVMEEAFKRLYTFYGETEEVFNIICCFVEGIPKNSPVHMNKLYERMEFLNLVMLNDHPLDTYVGVSPYLLTMDKKMILDQVGHLSGQFRPTEIRHVLENCPDLLLEPWHETERKIHYVFDEIGLDQPHMAFNQTLSHSFSHIRDRHLFLQRRGKYVKPKMHKDRLSYLQNARLEDIMDSTSEKFCQKIAEASSEEWQVFQELMAQEDALQAEKQEVVREQQAEYAVTGDGRIEKEKKVKMWKQKGQNLRKKRWQE